MMRRFLLAALMLGATAVQAQTPHPPPRPVPMLHAADEPLLPLADLQADWTVRYPERFPLQIAVLWTDPSARGLGLIHALQQMGLPFFVTRDLNAALKHPLLIVYPSVDGRTFSPDQTNRLQAYLQAGNTLWTQHVSAGGMRPLLGFKSVLSNRTRHRVDFRTDQDPAMVYLDRPEERSISLGSAKEPEVIWSDGYEAGPDTSVLARYEDGSAALLRHNVGKGQAYLFGLGLDEVVARCEANRDFEAERHYVNEFEPGADVWRLILRGWYETHARDWVRLGTMPNGLRSTLLMTHDVDWEHSVERCQNFADLEAAHHVDSTYFIQTKYLDDSNSLGFFFGQSIEQLRALKARGFDLESHSVLHAMIFNKFPQGSGEESFANYRAVARKEEFPGGTVFGELRVSKSLLDGEIPGQRTTCFRAGHLRVPPVLPQTLERCGYQFDSSFTADDVLSNFPYPLTRDLDFSTESAIYEFPVTIEDEASPLSSRLPRVLDVIGANADNGALSVILIHTNDPVTKVPAEKAILESLPAGVGVSDFLRFARFWKGRDQLRWTVESRELLSVRAPEPVTGATFEVQRPLAAVDGPARLADPTHVVLPALAAGELIQVHLHYR